MKPISYRRLLPWARDRAPVCAVIFFAFGLLLLATALQAIRFGPPRPVCEEVQRLEGVLHIEVIGPESSASRALRPQNRGGQPEEARPEGPRANEARYEPIQSGRSEPIVLIEGRVYRLGLRMGTGEEAPVIPARFRLEHGSYTALSAYGVGEDAFPMTDHYSINTHDQIQVFARNPGRRNLYLRVSECWKGGGRYLYAPAETLIPVIVLREEEGPR